MIKEVDLLSYLPPMMQEYYEMQKITAAENPEFQLLWDADAEMRNNIFILTAAEQGLKRFENIIGLYPSPKDSLESRRMRILSRWNDTLPYTLRYLTNVISILTGGDFEIIKDFDKYRLEIITHIGQFGGVDDLGYILKTVIPCNLVVVSTNTLEVIATGNVEIACVLVPTVIYMVTNDFDATYSIKGQINSGSYMSVVSEYQI